MGNEGSYRQRLSTFAANWRVLALRGLAAVLFGLVILFQPIRPTTYKGRSRNLSLRRVLRR